MHRPTPRTLPLALLTLAALTAGAHAQTTVTWSGASGELPESPCWTLTNSADTEQPLLQGGQLTLATSDDDENMYFGWWSELHIPPKLVIEARVQLVSGTSSASARAPAVIAFTTQPFTGNGLYIDHDRIFVLSSNSVVGASALLDTDDQPHTYRIEVTGTGAGSLLEVYYDGEAAPRLVDDLVADANINAPVPRILFGEVSVLAQGASAWELVSHNAGPAQCCGQVNSCGNLAQLAAVGTQPGATYDAGSGATWQLVLPGVPAAPSPGLLIYAVGAANPSTPLETTFGNLCVSPFFRGPVAVPGATSGGCANPAHYTWANWSAYVDANKAAGSAGFSLAGTDEVWVQAWHRDPALPAGATLSKVLGPFLVGP